MGWKDFEEFKEDAYFVAFVEIAFVDKGDGSENHFFAGCSCSHGQELRSRSRSLHEEWSSRTALKDAETREESESERKAS